MSQDLITQDANKYNKYVSIYHTLNKELNEQDAKNMFDVEWWHFCRLLEEKNLTDTTTLSQEAVFLEVIQSGLSFSPSANHIYLQSRNIDSKRKDASGKTIWDKRLLYSETAEGIIYLCKKAGSIIDCTVPVLVYEGDTIRVTDENGVKKIHHEKLIPRKQNANVLGGFCYVTKIHGKDSFWFDIEEMERLKRFSEINNSKWDENLRKKVPGQANEMYTKNNGKPDEGFIRTKIVRAALKKLPKTATKSVNNVKSFEQDAIMELPAGIQADQETGEVLNENETF